MELMRRGVIKSVIISSFLGATIAFTSPLTINSLSRNIDNDVELFNLLDYQRKIMVD